MGIDTSLRGQVSVRSPGVVAKLFVAVPPVAKEYSTFYTFVFFHTNERIFFELEPFTVL
jgi:hypothetical protein